MEPTLRSRSSRGSLREWVTEWVEDARVQNTIIAIIVFNAVTLGLETSVTVRAYAGDLLGWVERAVLTIFVVEILIKLYAYRLQFFRSGWNTFDFVIVGISLVPDAGPLAILRALRILRLLRLLTKMQRLRRIVESLLRAIPSIGWIAVLLLMVFYIFAVMGTKMFGESFPDDFGHLGLSMYSLFQIMTLESWSEEISRPIMERYPLAWLYFVTFILVTAFTVLNLFIGIIVSAMQEQHYEEEEVRRQESEAKAHAEREELLVLMRNIDERLQRLERR